MPFDTPSSTIGSEPSTTQGRLEQMLNSSRAAESAESEAMQRPGYAALSQMAQELAAQFDQLDLQTVAPLHRETHTVNVPGKFLRPARQVSQDAFVETPIKILCCYTEPLETRSGTTVSMQVAVGITKEGNIVAIHPKSGWERDESSEGFYMAPTTADNISDERLTMIPNFSRSLVGGGVYGDTPDLNTPLATSSQFSHGRMYAYAAEDASKLGIDVPMVTEAMRVALARLARGRRADEQERKAQPLRGR